MERYEDCHHGDHKSFQIPVREDEHEGQGEEHHNPSVDGDNHTRNRFSNLEILCDVGEQSDRNKLGGVEYKSREGQADEGEPVFECHISNSLSVIYTFCGTKLWNLSDNGI